MIGFLCWSVCAGLSLVARVQVIDLISLKPFDMEAISKSIKKTRNAIIVEECMKTGGIGASLSAIINESLWDELDHQVRMHFPLKPLPCPVHCCSPNSHCWVRARTQTLPAPVQSSLHGRRTFSTYTWLASSACSVVAQSLCSVLRSCGVCRW